MMLILGMIGHGGQNRQMPIPRFTDDGLLPPGLHAATLDKVVARFGPSGYAGQRP